MGAIKAPLNDSIPSNMTAAPSSPSEYLRLLLPGKRVRAMRGDHVVTAERMAAYDMVVVRAVQLGDLRQLRDLLKAGRSFDACNKQGETLLHMASRRGTLETVQFLVREAKVPLTYLDEVGRTVLHDACWRAKPDFALFDFLMHYVPPELLVAEDARGHSCLDYARKTDSKRWHFFLAKRAGLIQRELARYSKSAGSK